MRKADWTAAIIFQIVFLLILLQKKGRKKAMKRVGLLTSGGDCQALNATMRGIVKALSHNLDELEVYGFINGYHGMIYGDYRLLTNKDFSGILTKGGTMLGSSRTPFKSINEPDEKGLNKVDAMKQNYYKLRLDCLFVLGGNGSQKTANLLSQEGLNVIHLPKTIDNDIWGTDMTFGFYSAVNIATEAIDCIHTTAASHNRVFIVEVMGHKVGWLTLYAGIAGGADVILIPEIPYQIDKVLEAIDHRTRSGKGFTVLAVAEGAVCAADLKLSKKEYKKKMEKKQYPSVAYELADQILQKTGNEVRITVPGHTQRGGAPCPYDRALSTRLGVAAAMAFLDNDFGKMIGIVHDKTVRIPLKDSAGKLKVIEKGNQFVKEAKMLGISFGDGDV